MRYLFFFHNSDEYVLLFRAQGKPENKEKLVRPTFYWFSDSYHSHIPNYRYKYFYLFVKNPRLENILFESGRDGYDFHTMFAHYLEFLKERNKKGLYDKYTYEPSILMSFSDIIPDLIARYDKATGYHTIDRPLTHQGVKFRLFDDNGIPRAFNAIEEIVSAVPHINNSLPFVETERVDGVYTYEDFNQCGTDK